MGDILHLRSPDGRDWDGIVHVNPQGREKALAFFYNPLAADISRKIRVPLRYAGLSGKATVSLNGLTPTAMPLDREGCVTLDLKIPASSRTWVLFGE